MLKLHLLQWLNHSLIHGHNFTSCWSTYDFSFSCCYEATIGTTAKAPCPNWHALTHLKMGNILPLVSISYWKIKMRIYIRKNGKGCTVEEKVKNSENLSIQLATVGLWSINTHSERQNSSEKYGHCQCKCQYLNSLSIFLSQGSTQDHWFISL